MSREFSLSEGELKTKDACALPHGLPYGCTLSGAFAVLSQIRDAVCVVHGPVGCAHLNLANHWGASLIRQGAGATQRAESHRGAPSSPKNDPETLLTRFPQVVSTSLGETEVIFGGEEALRDTLDAAERRYGPPLMAVVSSCVAGVIGDDVEGVIRELREELRGKVLFVETDGFVSGGFDLGVNRAYHDLIEKLVEPPRSRDRDGVNILGEKALASDVEANFAEVRRLLEPLGLRVRTRFVRQASVEGIRTMTEAALNLVCSRETGLYPARLLKERYQMPFLEADFPVGRRETREWLRQLGRFLGREALAEEVARREEQAFLARLDRFKKVLAGKRVVVNTVDRQIDWVVDLLQVLEMEVVQINVFQLLRTIDADYRPRNLGSLDPSIPVHPVKGPAEIQEELERLRPDLCLGASRLSSELEGMAFLPIPMVPPVGTRGGLEMATRWYRTLKNPRREGWMKDGDGRS